ncbi:MAG: hypothetical protein KDI36_17270 [Pseudomonadales bacterium]|nr:hypothetical protein [Pseudomonadales bacterium]
MTTDKPDSEQLHSDALEGHYLPAAELWSRGCAGKPLNDSDVKKFISMARDRFYTFHLSVSHSRITGDGKKIDRLISGLARELSAAPGLSEQWFESEFSDSEFGSLVTAQVDQFGPDSQR